MDYHANPIFSQESQGIPYKSTLFSMSAVTLSSAHMICDYIVNIGRCCHVHVHFDDDGGVISREITEVACNTGYCNLFIRIIKKIEMALCSLSGLGIVLATMYYEDPKNFQHVNIFLHSNEKNKDKITLIRDYLIEYHYPRYSLNVSIL